MSAVGEDRRTRPPLHCAGRDWWEHRPRPGRSDKRAQRRAKLARRRPGAYAPDRERVTELVEMSVLVYLWDGRCWLCRRPVETQPTMDHVIPLALGGDHTYNNVRLAHKPCNETKADLTPDEHIHVPPVWDIDLPLQ